MRIKRLMTVMICAVTAASITACSPADFFIRQHGYNDRQYRVEIVKNPKNIEDKSFYVQKLDGTYHKPYIGETTFSGNNSGTRNRVAWFGKDYDKIPTMNKGEKIVYRSTDEFSPEFSVERFQDLGYTLGICGMSPTSTGRYQFSTDPTDRSININSSAGKLYELGTHKVTMEVIGDTELRGGNISQAGTILGLQRGKTYSADIYIGTEIIDYDLIADVRAMKSMEDYTITEFAYDKNKVVSFSFPDYFNSGYYFVGGFGMVRYIDSDREFSEEIAMNIPNPTPDQETDNGEEEIYETIAATTETVPFMVDKKDFIEVAVSFDTAEGSSTAAQESAAGSGIVPPTGRVVGESGSYTLNINESGDSLVGVFELEPGEYRIEIKGLAGRSYSYTVRKKQEAGDSSNG